jgi:hypothetical protein
MREVRKARQQKDTIPMCDGTSATASEYHHLRSTAHQKFRGSHKGCAETLRCAIPKAEWRELLVWIEDNRPDHGNKTRQNDALVAVAVGYAAQRRQRCVEDLFAEIIRDGTATALLTPAGT